MFPSARTLPVLLALIFAAGAHAQPAASSAAGGARRLPPSRAAGAYVRINDVEYSPVSDFERRHGLHGVWLIRDEKYLLKNERWQIELVADSRECRVNGHRILLALPCRTDRHRLVLSRVDAERILGPILGPGYGQGRVPDLKVIAIDPGHGGVDNGTQNAALKLSEKKLALDVALRLGAILKSEGYTVVYTRATDIKIELPLRAATANAAGADLFVSIHFNSLPKDNKTSGTEIFTFAPAGVRSTDAWGGHFNDTEPEPSPGNRYDHWNAVVAYALQREMLASLKTFDRGKKLAHFGVLRPLNCPGVLIESGFLSNEAEARKIGTPEYREQIARSIARGIRSYGDTLRALRPKP